MPAYSYDQWCKDFARSFAAAVPMDSPTPAPAPALRSFAVVGIKDEAIWRATLVAPTSCDAVNQALDLGVRFPSASPTDTPPGVVLIPPASRAWSYALSVQRDQPPTEFDRIHSMGAL